MIGPVDPTCIPYTVPAIDIIDITVLVVIDIIVWNLSFVLPHIRGDIGMVILYRAVYHSHHHASVTTGKSPCILHSKVATFIRGIRHMTAACVDVMPLVNEHRVIEWKVLIRRHLSEGRTVRCELQIRSRRNDLVILDSHDRSKRSKLCSCGCIADTVELHLEPLVKIMPSGNILLAWSDGEDRLESLEIHLCGELLSERHIS